jgi:DNA-binding NtrC family response regulator
MGSASRTSEFEKLLHLPFRESVQAWERLLIDRALEAANGNKAEAARKLGIHRRLLYEKLGSSEES